MPTHPKPDLAVTALLQSLTDELDRKNMKKMKMEDLMLANMQSSVRGRLGRRINEQHAQISHWQGGSKLCGAIFMCNKRTWKECLGQSLFGLPIGKKGLVEQIIPGMKLFLFEFERRQLWGVFEAASYGDMNIIPNAYTGGSFPCQVRVKVPENCVALYEEEFCETIRDNYYGRGKFNFDLSEKQVCRLARLFERKYLSANISSSNLLKYEDERYILDDCKSNGGLPLLLANDENSVYLEELTNVPLFSDSEEYDRDHSYKNAESRSRRKTSEKGSLVPLSNGVLDIVQNNVASLAGELGKGFDTVNASCLMFYDSNNHFVVEDFSTEGISLFSDSVSRLHSDRPIAKSVWARISGRSKSFGPLESIQPKKSPEVAPVVSLPKICTVLEMNVEDESLVQDQDCCRADASEEAAEEFSIGFKRRRASNNNASTKVDETPSKRRRKLARPSFEDAADEHLVEQGKCVAEKPPLPSANGALDFSKSSSMAGMVEDFGGNVSVLTELPMKLEEKVYLSRDTVSDQGEGVMRKIASGCNQENGILQPVHDGSQPNIDLNLPLEVSVQNDQGLAMVLENSPVLKDEMQFITDATTRRVSGITEIPTKLDQDGERGPNSLICEMQQELSLALSLATQETVLHSREGINDRNPANLVGHLQKQSEALMGVEDVGQDQVNRPQIFIGQSEQGGRADGEGVNNETDFLGKAGQGSDVQQCNVSFVAGSLDLAPADSLRTSTLSIAPCTQAKDFLDSSYSVGEHCDDAKGSSHGLEQDIPLTLELGNGAQLSDVTFRLHDIIHPDHAPGNSYTREGGDNTSCQREHGDNAVVHDGSLDGNQSRESKTISIDCTAGSNFLNQGDLKTFLSSLQVSGIKLQLGVTPCLIFQLGDSAGSSSNVDNQEQGGGTSGQSEPS